MMDFDKQYGNGAPASMINKGRGFTEKPIIKPAVVHRQPRARSAPRKVTAKTQFVITSSRNSPRRMVPDRYDGSMGSRGRRNDMAPIQMRGQRRFINSQRDSRRNPRFNNRGPARGGRRGDNRRKLTTEEEMNQQLNKYFEKDEDVMKQRLDSELQQYCQQGQAMNQQMETPAMNQPVMSEGQPMQ